MPIIWTIGLDGKEKEDFVTYLRNSRPLSDKLCEIIEKYIEGLERAQLQDALYEQPELTNRLCYLNGQLRAFKTVLDLFKFNQGT